MNPMGGHWIFQTCHVLLGWGESITSLRSWMRKSHDWMPGMDMNYCSIPAGTSVFFSRPAIPFCCEIKLHHTDLRSISYHPFNIPNYHTISSHPPGRFHFRSITSNSLHLIIDFTPPRLHLDRSRDLVVFDNRIRK